MKLFPFTWRGHLVGYFEETPGGRYQVTTAWQNSAGVWHEHHLLNWSVDEAAASVKDLVDYGRTVERMERELGRPLTMEELATQADPADQVTAQTGLAPCPFCGGPAEAIDATGDHTVSCARRNHCEAYAVAGPYPTQAEAAVAWNRRGGCGPEVRVTLEQVRAFEDRPGIVTRRA